MDEPCVVLVCILEVLSRTLCDPMSFAITSRSGYRTVDFVACFFFLFLCYFFIIGVLVCLFTLIASKDSK